MVARRAFCVGLALALLPEPAVSDQDPREPSPDIRTLSVSHGNHGFLHEIGAHVPSGWVARYRLDSPGYFIRGYMRRGDRLPVGVYRYTFYFSLEPGSLGGLLQKEDDVIRVEVWDATANERLVVRTFQKADFPTTLHDLTRKTIVFSTQGRARHQFEPRVFWPGLCGIFLHHAELQRIDVSNDLPLHDKALLFERLMDDAFDEDGFVVSRRDDGRSDDVGDAAIWTGLYAAAEAWRYRATHEVEALHRMESALRALHRLHVLAPQPGTLVRFPERRDGAVFAASRDTYTGFFFALAQTLPLVKDPGLRQTLIDDAAALGNHLIDHDLAFVPASGLPLNLSPYPTRQQIAETVRELSNDGHARRRLVRTLQAVHFYFLTHRQRPWPEAHTVIDALQHNDADTLRRALFPALRGALAALRQLQRNVDRSDRAYPVFRAGVEDVRSASGDTPYGKLNRLLARVLYHLDDNLDGAALDDWSQLKVLSSQSLMALHFLKVIGTSLPQPNRFETYYEANLWRGKELLKTFLAWNNIDDDLSEAFQGHTKAAANGGGSQHISFLALYDLISLETDPGRRQCYRAAFEKQFWPHQEDMNAMLHMMRGVLKMAPDQTGVASWVLSLYPLDRHGKGDAYWSAKRAALAERYGGEVSEQASDPLFLSDRQRDMFIWQRVSRGIGGDDARKRYPPLDFLFVYWMGRASGELQASD